MQRRDLIRALTATLATRLACTLISGKALAQTQAPGKLHRIGFLFPSTRADFELRINAFTQGLKDSGYIEGRNIQVDWRFADGDYARLPGLAAELARNRVELIATDGTPAALAAQKAARATPIVAIGVSDPVGIGLAASLARPDGNVTGMSTIVADAMPKRTELLRVALPHLSRAAALLNPDNQAVPAIVKNLNAAMSRVGMQAVVLDVRNIQDVDRAFSRIAQERIGALIIGTDTAVAQHYKKIAELALRQRVVTIGSNPEFISAGGLMMLGPDTVDIYRRSAIYVDKILKGAKPGELPFQEPMRIKFIVNARVAKAMGFTLPPELLLRADEVIE